MGAMSAPQLGQLGGADGRKRGLRAFAHTLQVKAGWDSDVMLCLGYQKCLAREELLRYLVFQLFCCHYQGQYPTHWVEMEAPAR